MPKFTLNGAELEVPDGTPLVEAIKDSGEFISNLCYVDGLPPYAGCRTCIVEIEGMRGFQLSCTNKVAEGMIVRTQTPELRSTRQAVLSLILSYHSDRCLTCHRIVKCKPGDTCLRDDSVTHRCLTCSKNYRCELQTTCEMLEMAGYEPWDGDNRTYYNLPQPPADQNNPFLEFDPQMCIICTRCVRACDEIRHTGAITLAGRGFSTRIAFGQGGDVHDSNCDFCGACIDVCPTATLMEHPNKWSATQTERWTPTTCTQCSGGCSIHLGTKKGKGVIVKPDTHANPVSRDQICVRGRFHYDAVKPAQRLSTVMIKRNGGLDASTWDEALEFTAASLAQIREKHGPDAIGFLASPLATNEENYLLGKIARAVVGTNNIDSSAGPVARAAAASLVAAFSSEVLPTDGTRVAESKTLLVVADDLESSHNLYSLRAKDAVVRNEAKLVVVSSLWGELNDFAAAIVVPKPGDEAAIVAALAEAVAGGDAAAGRALVSEAAAFDKAVDVLKGATSEGGAPFTAIAGLSNFGASAAGAIVGSLANISMSLAGADAAKALLVLPQEANVWGMRDVGGSPDLLPGHRSASDEAARAELRRVWGAEIASKPGLTFERMTASGKKAGVRALVILNDNPLMLTPGAKLDGIEFVAVIDSVQTDTAKAAHALLPDTGAWAKEGTTVSADRRVLRLNPATDPRGEAQQGWRILADLGKRLVERFGTGEIRINYGSAGEIMDEMAQVIPLFRDSIYKQLDSGQQQNINGNGPKSTNRVAVQATRYSNGHDGTFTLTTSRGLYTSYEAAAIHAKDADRLHREDSLKMHPDDAAALGVANGDVVTVKRGKVSFQAPVQITAAVQPKMLHLPSYYDAGVPAALFEADSPVASVEVSR